MRINLGGTTTAAIFLLASASAAASEVHESATCEAGDESCGAFSALSLNAKMFTSALKEEEEESRASNEGAEAKAEETKTIYVVFNTFEDTNNTASLIMHAMEEAGMKIDDWTPKDSHHVPDHTATFPVKMDMEFVRGHPTPPADSTSEALLEEEEEEELDDDLTLNMTLVELHLEGKEGKRKPTKKQKKWAARQISKLESVVCSRYRERKYAAYGRSSYGKWPWYSCDSGWEDIAGICYKNCASGYYPVWFLCHQSCGKREDTMSECIERCRDVPGSPSPIDHTCSLFYCGQTAGDCAEQGAKIALSFAMMFANFVPGGKALGALKTAVKQGSKTAFKAAMKKAAWDILKKMRKKVKKNIKKVMKEERKELSNEFKEAILAGGAEEVAAVAVAKTQSGALKDKAVEVLKAVDPTGIADVVDSFEADRCRDKKIDSFPEDTNRRRRSARRRRSRRRRYRGKGLGKGSLLEETKDEAEKTDEGDEDADDDKDALLEKDEQEEEEEENNDEGDEEEDNDNDEEEDAEGEDTDEVEHLNNDANDGKESVDE